MKGARAVGYSEMELLAIRGGFARAVASPGLCPAGMAMTLSGLRLMPGLKEGLYISRRYMI